MPPLDGLAVAEVEPPTQAPKFELGFTTTLTGDRLRCDLEWSGRAIAPGAAPLLCDSLRAAARQAARDPGARVGSGSSTARSPSTTRPGSSACGPTATPASKPVPTPAPAPAPAPAPVPAPAPAPAPEKRELPAGHGSTATPRTAPAPGSPPRTGGKWIVCD
ncbi:hypothetical protein NKH77_44350 [Streptomyces sp. M19]